MMMAARMRASAVGRAREFAHAPKKPKTTATSSAMDALLAQQTQQMQQESPLRKLLLSQSAGLLPSYMKSDPNYAKWLQNSAPQAQAAMRAAAQRTTPYDV